ncbi:hypothetical protein [Mesorhizobium amorphae]
MRGELVRNHLQLSIFGLTTVAHGDLTFIGARQTSLLDRIGKRAPPDFLVDDVGHFSPA